MDDELVLLTSYFNLVEGRRQDEADTFRVDTNLQSASSPDGSAALYIVTESSIGGHAGPRARRLAADTIAWEYASHGDEPPVARLKGALRVAHEEIRREFEGQVAIGASVMAVERDTVYLAQVPPSQVYVLHEGSLHSIPASSDGPGPYSRSLGGEGSPRISVFKDQIAPGDVVSLASTWFDRAADAARIRECFGSGTSDEIAESLLELAQDNDVRDATSIVVEAALSSELEVVPTGDHPPTFVEQIDSAVHALANVGRMIWQELKPPPAESPNGTKRVPEPAPATEAREPIPAASAQGESVPDASPAPAPARPTPSASASAATSEVPLVPSAPPQDWTVPIARPGVEDELVGERAPTDEGGYDEPTSVTIPPVDTAAQEESPAVEEAPAVPVRPARDDVTEELTRVPPPPEPVLDPPPLRRASSRPERRTPPVPPIRKQAAEAPPTEEPTEDDSGKGSELEQVNSRLHESQDMSDVIPPVQAFEDTGTEPARIYATSKDIQAANRRPRRFGGSVPVIRPGLTDIDLRQRVTRPALPALVWASLAVLLLVIAGAFVYFLKNQLATHRKHANPYVALVKQDITYATSASTSAKQDYYLSRARANLTLAQQNGASVAWVTKTRQQIATTSDTLHHITREASPVLITDFSKFPGAQPTEIATAPGLVYVVDPNRKSAFSVKAVANASPTALVKSGDTYSSLSVGTPEHIATDGATAIVADDKQQLFRTQSGTTTGTTLTQQSQGTPHDVAMTVYDPDVYMLDTAGSQVWRYINAVSGYNPPQAGYWDNNPPKLGNGVSIAFDKTSLYILRSDGSVLKYDLQAAPQKFSVGVTTPLAHPVSLYTDSNQKWVWIADPGNKRIVQLDKDGNFSRAYMSSSAMDLSKTKSISVGPDGKTIYVLAGSRLYDFPVAG